MPIYLNNASCSTELFEALNDTDGFSQVSTNVKKYLLVFGVCMSASILEFKALCIDVNLKWLSLCSSAIEGDHVCMKLTKTACLCVILQLAYFGLCAGSFGRQATLFTFPDTLA